MAATEPLSRKTEVVTRPDLLPFQPEGIPQVLADAPRWMIWCPVWNGTKFEKKPTRSGFLEPANLTTLAVALERCFLLGVTGDERPGFVVGGEFVAFDFDDCLLIDGMPEPLVAATLETLNSYTALSVSGNGLHCICRVNSDHSLPPVGPGKTDFEFYSQSRFMALTGHVLRPQKDVRLATGEVESILQPCRITKNVPAADLPHWSEFDPGLMERQVFGAARAYLLKMEPAVEGCGGSAQFMRASSALQRGFLLDESEARSLLSEYNERCEPPFDKSEYAPEPDSFERKLSEGREPRASPHEPGRLLKNPDPRRAAGRFNGLDISEFTHYANAPVEWLVEDVFAADQPTVFGARSKCLKTTQLVDLAIALGSGTNWLGKFKVPAKRRVLFITGESTAKAIGRRLYKACEARFLKLNDLKGMVRVETLDFPKLPFQADCLAIKEVIDSFGFEVVILDPLYRAIPGDLDTNRLSHVGEAITGFAKHCQPASLIISHHTTKTAAREYGAPPVLEDMSGAGIAESCGNWWLVGRNVKYGWKCVHDLCVSYGGRDEQCGAKRLVFDERSWSAQVEPLHEYIDGQKRHRQKGRESAKQESERQRIGQARLRILEAARRSRAPQAKTTIRDLSGQSGSAFARAFSDLIEQKRLVIRSYVDGSNRRKPDGYLYHEYSAEWDASNNQ